MQKRSYQSMQNKFSLKRREFLKTGGVVGAGLVLGNPAVWQENKYKSGQPDRIKTNIEDLLKIPKTKNSLPGLFPGKVVQVYNKDVMPDMNPNSDIVNQMFSTGIEYLTGKSVDESYALLFEKDDIVGIKVNPVGAGLISTRLEVVDAVIDWLVR
ncbi:MAG: twin-arginine translocation signal domain-containing protein, partial [Calditrichia bacterium]|nr:twin-arginine translocation signal domain-containing protein [Calditrichia bacterium]